MEYLTEFSTCNIIIKFSMRKQAKKKKSPLQSTAVISTTLEDKFKFHISGVA